jgi:predicted Zn-dependent peptidase
VKHVVKEIRLKNGAQGLLIDVPDATVMSFQFNFRAGNRFVKKHDIYETAHIMEHLAFGANEKFKDEHAYEAEFTKNGAYHNASTGDLNMDYVATCADFEWDRILELQQLSITTPKFNQSELEAEKGNVKSELTGSLNNYNRVLWPKLQQTLGEDVLTYQERLKTIPQVTLAHIRDHYKRTHTAENLRFVIAGKLHGREATLKRLLESWQLPHGERFAAPKDELTGTKLSLIRRKEALNLTFGLSMVVKRQLSDQEQDAMDCLNHILTGTMYSRIFGAARKRGLVYGLFSDTSSYEHDSAWDFGGEVNLETAEEVFDIIVKELKAILAGKITDDEIETAKQYALGRHQMGAQTASQISGFYSGRYFFDGVVRDYNKVPNEIASVTRSKITPVARDFIKSNTWILGGVASEGGELMESLRAKIATVFEE